MDGLMMTTPLVITSLIQFAARYHHDTSVVTCGPEGEVRRASYNMIYKRAQSLANALQDFGIKPGDRVATLAWNSDRHLELYYAISGMGAVCHTINLRLADQELLYILNHAEDRLLFFDADMAETVARLQPQLPHVEQVIALTDAGHMPTPAIPGARDYESFIAGASDHFDWPVLDENMAASLCYTSGTTGEPKGVLYSHRATVLHAMASCFASTLNLQTEDVILPVVPMFHVNAWGIPYSAPIAGSTLVMPGRRLDGASLFDLMDREGVTIALGVPTVWLGLLNHMDHVGRKPSALTRVIIGGAATSEAMVKRFEVNHGVTVHTAWGMTETSPVGVVNSLKPKFQSLPADQQMPIKLKQGRAIYGIELRIVDDEGQDLPRDGQSSGRLLVKGPWVARQYYKADRSALTPDGWFDTGDIATLDSDGYMQITDRAKDVIKSGGEWISSVGLENAAVGHPAISAAAVIAVPHPKWQERPLLVCESGGKDRPSLSEIREYLTDKVPKLWLPDAVEWVDSLPLGATGKVLKSDLRSRFADYQLPEEGET